MQNHSHIIIIKKVYVNKTIIKILRLIIGIITMKICCPYYVCPSKGAGMLKRL